MLSVVVNEVERLEWLSTSIILRDAPVAHANSEKTNCNMEDALDRTWKACAVIIFLAC